MEETVQDTHWFLAKLVMILILVFYNQGDCLFLTNILSLFRIYGKIANFINNLR